MKIGTVAVGMTIGVAAVLSLGGCASAQRAGSPAIGSQNPGAGSADRVVHESDNGMTVDVAVGGRVLLEGFSSAWKGLTSTSEAVVSDAAVRRPACTAKPIGTPCTLPTLMYSATGKGTVTLSAHRTQCGEARMCAPPADAADFTLTIVVG